MSTAEGPALTEEELDRVAARFSADISGLGASPASAMPPERASRVRCWRVVTKGE